MASVKDGSSASGVSRSVRCSKCQDANPNDRRYCGKCGELLWQPCLKCGNRNAIDVAFCGGCGIDLEESFQKTIVIFENKLKTARELEATGDFAEALSALRIVMDRGDTRLEKYGREATELYDRISATQKTKYREREQLEQLARNAFEQHDFEAAKQNIQKIPASIRTEPANDLLANAEARLDEIASLNQEVKHGLQSKSYDDLLPNVERLIELQPSREQLLQIQRKLLDRQSALASKRAAQVINQAKAAISSSDFDNAEKLLESAEYDLLNDDVKHLVDQLRELCWLRKCIGTSRYLTSNLKIIAGRYQKRNPKDPLLSKVIAQMQSAAKAKTDARLAAAKLRDSDSSSLNLPVFWWGGFRNVDWDDANTVQKMPGRFSVAFGLALSALQSDSISVNLKKDKEKSFLKRIGGKKSARGSWGIDIGNSGIKAVQLTGDPNSELSGRCAVVNHQADLYSITELADRMQVLRDSMEALVAQAEMDREQAIVSISSSKTLGRFFEIPKMKSKKVEDAINYEAKVQIPIDINEIEFDYHLWAAAENMHSVGLFAARRTDLEAIDSLFDENLSAIQFQPEPIALVNAAIHQFCSKDNDRSIGVLDVGVGKSTLAVGGNQGLRFRNLWFGVEQWANVVAKELNLDIAIARKTCASVESAKWLHRISRALQPAYAEAVAEIQKSLANIQKDGFEIDQIVVTGGGAAELGFIDYLQNAN